MQKTLLITGATDGIGLEAAKRLAADGHTLLLHGRNQEKLDEAVKVVPRQGAESKISTFRADLSRLSEVESLAAQVTEKHQRLDALINNAGVLNSDSPRTEAGLDVRFVVNTLAPYLLTKRLLPLLGTSGRVVNVSSAAQAPVAPKALSGDLQLDDMGAYSQSKLAITMWTTSLAASLGKQGPVVVAVNPASLLGSKMVKSAFGVEGKDLGIGADILIRAATADDFADATGKYFDNDAGQFGPPHPDAQNLQKCDDLVQTLDSMLETYA